MPSQHLKHSPIPPVPDLIQFLTGYRLCMVSVIPTSAYIHVPFCLHKCGYCDFTVVAGRDDLIDIFLDCLEQELQLQLKSPQSMQTVFIGGGTPTYLPAKSLQRLMQLLKKWMPLTDGGEFSIECNPEGFTTDRMDVLQAAGINRISLGVQAFQSQHLQTLERSHSAETVARVIASLRDRHFSNLSIDLIFGIPGQTLAEWQTTLDQAIELAPRHVSTYGLTYEKGTAFWTRREKQQLRPIAEELEREMYALAMSTLPEHGFQQYELSNFAQPGAASRHNQVYWQGEPYYGIGPGAAGFQNSRRVLNHRSVTTWIKRLQQGLSPIQETEDLDLDLQRREAVMLGLRQIAGIDQRRFQQQFGMTVRDLEPAAYARFLNLGWLMETASHVRLTVEGRFVADSVMSEFL